MKATFKNVSYRIGTLELTVPEFRAGAGELVLVAGSNGTGKTTLCRILAGLLTASYGVKYETLELPEPRPVLLWQDLQLFPVSVASNLAIVNEDKDTVAHLLREAGLFNKRRQSVERLSGGEKERLALARALAVPDATHFLFDEPTKAADKERVKEVANAIVKATTKGNKGVVVVTHDERLVSELSSWVSSFYIIDRHSVPNSGHLLSRVLGPFDSARFFGEPATVFAAKFAGYENIFGLPRDSIGNGPPSGRRLSIHDLLPYDTTLGTPVLIVPWAAIRVERTPFDDSVEVNLTRIEFRTNGSKVVRCVWDPDGGTAVELVAQFEQRLNGYGTAFLSINFDLCQRITT